MMNTIDSQRLIVRLLLALREAGIAVMDVYSGSFEVDYKADNSPVTIADRLSNSIISRHLKNIPYERYPILSEEGKSIPYEVRREWLSYWLLDPLDGTKEFIGRNGEFTINIALMRRGQPIIGLVYAPAFDMCYFGIEGIGSYKIELGWMSEFNDLWMMEFIDIKIIQDIWRRAIWIRTDTNINEDGKGILVIGSRSHKSEHDEQLMQALNKTYGSVTYVATGSSLKFCLIADGQAHVYPRFGSTMEWDIAAGQAVLENAGGVVLRYENGERLIYNKENLLNPWFVAGCADYVKEVVLKPNMQEK